MAQAQIYFRAGTRGTMLTGPFPDIETAKIAVRSAGLKVRDVGYLRKDGPNLVKIDAMPDYVPMRNAG